MSLGTSSCYFVFFLVFRSFLVFLLLLLFFLLCLSFIFGVPPPSLVFFSILFVSFLFCLFFLLYYVFLFMFLFLSHFLLLLCLLFSVVCWSLYFPPPLLRPPLSGVFTYFLFYIMFIFLVPPLFSSISLACGVFLALFSSPVFCLFSIFLFFPPRQFPSFSLRLPTRLLKNTLHAVILYYFYGGISVCKQTTHCKTGFPDMIYIITMLWVFRYIVLEKYRIHLIKYSF